MCMCMCMSSNPKHKARGFCPPAQPSLHAHALMCMDSVYLHMHMHSPHWQDHKLLHGKAIACMGATVDDVEGRHGQHLHSRQLGMASG